MVKLLASLPFEGLLPLEAEDVSVEAVYPDFTFLVHDTGAAVSGMAFPAPGKITREGGARLMWIGPGQALLIGAAPEGGTVVDQSDAWATARLTGPRALEVLARLVPVDLRGLGEGQTARTMLGHMMASVSRMDGGFEVLVMRSMAGTLVHDLERAILTSARD